ncbi:uncharacterized protein LOC142319206 [Lycorma delicatula]|uniref:uncharacterized protein LOC142319206 n=1 Tax=Lycorma delicatula TaxID=130591 RepID=UPI003F517235
MFKKKNELPPWPKPPTNDQMLEDITSAPPDDPVFSEFSSQKKNSSDKSNVDITYDLVRKFLNASKKLEKSLTSLQEQNDLLQVNDTELRKMADDIRQRAEDALK